MVKLLIIADDFTGALDTGVILPEQTMGCRFWSWMPKPAICGRSRHIP